MFEMMLAQILEAEDPNAVITYGTLPMADPLAPCPCIRHADYRALLHYEPLPTVWEVALFGSDLDTAAPARAQEGT